jgi:hypothetical protein
MSNSKNAISEIKKLMVQFGFMAAEPTLLSFKLEDDTILETEKLEEGIDIFKINEQFERVVLEDGSYSIEEFDIEVADGKIKTINEKFVNATLKDGTQVSISGKGLETGGKIFVIKDGVPTPAPDGDHELEDGSVVTVKDGEIVSVQAPENEAPGEDAAPEEADSPAEAGMEAQGPVVDETVKKDGELNPQMMGEMYDMLKDFVAKCGQKMAEMEGQYKSLESEFEAFKKEPAGSKIKYSKSDAFSKVDDEVDARLANILQMRKNKK